ncbi:MAG: Gfo/Idh/MocA family protein [Syntrophothermus sp.]
MTNATLTETKPCLAFAGTGWIGLNRMDALLKQDICRATGIFDPLAESVVRARESAPDATIYESFEEMVAMEPDGMVIATPNALHARQSILALRAGIPVFCQKPLGRNAEETLQVIKTARNADRLLGVDFSYRYTDGMQKIRELTQAGQLGNIFAIDLVFNSAFGPDKAWFYDPRLSGGGCLIDLGIHLVDLALWILHFPSVDNVSSILAAKGKIITGESVFLAEDYISAQFETENGTSVRLTCSWNLPAGQDAEIKASFYGTKAAALFYNVNGSLYEFETAMCQGTSRRIISHPPDDWGPRALIDWTTQLAKDDAYQEEAIEYYYVADVLDKIYKRKI